MKPTIYLKRLNNEVMDLIQDNYAPIHITHHSDRSEVTICKKQLVIPNTYPFIPPELYIQIHNQKPQSYTQLLKCPSNRVQLLMANHKIGCLCCSSILNSINWTPSTTIRDILDDVRNTYELKRNIMALIMIDAIMLKRKITDDIGSLIKPFIYPSFDHKG